MYQSKVPFSLRKMSYSHEHSLHFFIIVLILCVVASTREGMSFVSAIMSYFAHRIFIFKDILYNKMIMKLRERRNSQ